MKRSTITGALVVIAGVVLLVRTLARGREPAPRAEETIASSTPARSELTQPPATEPAESAHREALAPSIAERSDAEPGLAIDPTLAYVTGQVTLPSAAEHDSRYASVELQLVGVPLTTGSQSDALKCGVSARGQFELGAVDPRRTYFLRVSYLGPLLAPPEAELHFAPGEHRELEVVLERGASVAGRVLDSRGAPVADVWVGTAGSSWYYPSDDGRSATTDEHGLFALVCLPPGVSTLEARIRGRMFATRECELAPDEARTGLDLRLDIGRISGTLRLPDGSPAARAFVTLAEARDDREYGTIDERCDELGRFAFDEVAQGPHALAALATISPGSDATVVYGTAHRTGVFAGTSDLDLVVAPAPELHGIVHDASGEPVESFNLRVWSEAKHTLSLLDDRWSSYPAPGGAFRVQVPEAGEWRVEVDGKRLGRCARVVRVPQASPCEFVLAPQPDRVFGRVLDPAGHPVHASVRFLPDVFSGGETDDDGAFDLEVKESTRELVAIGADYAESEPQELPEAGHEVVLRLRVGARVFGRVVDPSGRPLPGRLVGCAAGRVAAKDTEAKCRTDAAGRFTFEHVTPGKVYVWIEDVDGTSQSPTPADGESIEVELVASAPARVR